MKYISRAGCNDFKLFACIQFHKKSINSTRKNMKMPTYNHKHNLTKSNISANTQTVHTILAKLFLCKISLFCRNQTYPVGFQRAELTPQSRQELFHFVLALPTHLEFSQCAQHSSHHDHSSGITESLSDIKHTYNNQLILKIIMPSLAQAAEPSGCQYDKSDPVIRRNLAMANRLLICII